jgi:guanylate kinase
MNEGQFKKAREESPSGNPKKAGLLFIISAPSGAGKSTLVRAVRKRFPDLLYSVSYTTRLPRKGEQNGVDYHFITKEAFETGISQSQWAEWADVHGNYYGTPSEFLDKNIASGQDVLLDIDVQGTRQVVKRYPDSITIFIMPPSPEILRYRLETRGTDSPETIDVRMKNARTEMAHKNLYGHVIVNDRLQDAVAELIALLEKYRL